MDILLPQEHLCGLAAERNFGKQADLVFFFARFSKQINTIQAKPQEPLSSLLKKNDGRPNQHRQHQLHHYPSNISTIQRFYSDNSDFLHTGRFLEEAKVSVSSEFAPDQS